MNTKIEVTSRDFLSLRCPYTGEPLRTYMLVSPSGVRFFAPGARSPRDRYPTARDLYDAWATRAGISGVARGDDIKCPYTGETLEIRSDASGFWYSGGFDPAVPRSRDEFLYYASMRDGVSKYPKPGAQDRVDPVLEQHAFLKHKTIETTDFAMKEAEKAMHRSGLDKTIARETKVSMSVPRPKTGGKKR